MSTPYLTADEMATLLPPAAATRAIVDAVSGGLDPSRDPARDVIGLGNGQLLLMPAHTDDSVGVKVVTVAPDNPGRGLPRIQGMYLLFDPTTLRLRALLDGPGLTSIRTPAVSAAVVGAVATRFDRPVRVVILGAGPQATGHVHALRAIDGLVVEDVAFVVRNPDRASSETPGPLLAAGGAAALSAVRQADIVICATTARTPVVDGSDIRAGAVVVAIGSHEPDARELDTALMSRAAVVVEDVDTALREAGDVIIPVGEGVLRPADLIPMADLLRGVAHVDPSRTFVFKGTGMSWQDLVVADALMRAREAAA